MTVRCKIPTLNPCSCGCEWVDEVESNGISIVYDCSRCGDFVGELLVGPEP